MVTGNEVSAHRGFGGFPRVTRARKFEACHHFSLGLNFNAVCVGENDATFISANPTDRPAAITSFSVTVSTPFG